MNGVDCHSAHAISQPTIPTLIQPSWPAPLISQQESPITNGIAHAHPPGEEEEPYTIKCVCGYHDDDGNTVLCEKCNSWQHIECYYPAKNVPEIHKCVDCDPRPLDAKSAAERQKRLREAQVGSDKKARRPATKNARKKPGRESAQPNGPVNGCAVHGEPGLDRKIGSPRDQPPPAKRPKTSHKPSGSTVSLNDFGSVGALRSATANLGPGVTSPVKVPLAASADSYLGPLYSSDFIALYPAALHYQQIDSNSFHDIGVTGSLSAWLKDPTALANVTNGKTRAEVYQQYDRPIEELQAPGIESHVTEDASVSIHGGHPTWQWLSIDRPVVSGAFVGELIGQIGRREDYVKDPANRWSSLRHPEPFVFFPPHLPIYIDTRAEGNILRGIRRSCRPNVKMNVLITDGIMYHFCFIATREIAQDEEITIGWDVDEDVHRLIHASVTNGNIKKEGFQIEEEQYISNWVTGVLSNFGGCPCDRSLGGCVMDRFTRPNGLPLEPLTQPAAKAQRRRKKKTTKQTSPMSSGHATISRAASEVWNINDVEDGNVTDGHSVSASSHSKPGSRDMTPATQSSLEVASTSGLELSDRERRKIIQQERLFDKLAAEENGPRRKNRTSGGSATTTPVATSTRFSDSPTSLPSSNPTRRRAFSDAPKDQQIVGLSRQSLSYSELCTQTDISSMPPPNQSRTSPARRFSSLSQRILRRCHLARSRINSDFADGEASSHLQSQVPANMPPTEVETAGKTLSAATLSPQLQSTGSKDPNPDGSPQDEIRIGRVEIDSEDRKADTEMQDVKDISSEPERESMVRKSDGAMSQVSTQLAHPPLQPPPPPWPDRGATSLEADEIKIQQRTRPTGLQVQLPLSSHNNSTTPNTPSAANVTSASGLGITQSPTAITPKPSLQSPALANIISHSSAKKRISFSDYMNRKVSSSQQATSVPAAVSSPSSITSNVQPQSTVPLPTTNGNGMGPPTAKVNSVEFKREENAGSAHEIMKAAESLTVQEDAKV